MDFKIGDMVDVQYLSSSWMNVQIVDIKEITQAQADDARKWYPHIQAGDIFLVCDSGGDTRNFLPGHDKVRRAGETEAYVLPRLRTPVEPPPPPFEAKVETGTAVKPLHPIKLKPRSP